MRLVLIRHAPAQRDPAVASSEWGLGDEGRAAAHDLGTRLPPLGLLLTSPLPKAVGTAEEVARAAGGELRIDDRLRETHGGDRWDERHRELAARYVAGEALPGWEPQAEAIARLDAALADAAATATGAVGAVSHGRLLALWLAAVAALADPAAFWDALRYPDAWELELAATSAGWAVVEPPRRLPGGR